MQRMESTLAISQKSLLQWQRELNTIICENECSTAHSVLGSRLSSKPSFTNSNLCKMHSNVSTVVFNMVMLPGVEC